MSCEILIGRTEPCKDSMGGLKNVYFFNEEPTTTLMSQLPAENFTGLDDIPAYLGDTICFIDDVTNLYKFELKANENTYVENVLSDRNNGTTVYQQVLNIKLKKQDATTHKYLKLLAYGKVRVVVENNNNQYFLMGLKFGADVTGGTITSGGAKVDHNGYTLTLTSEELKPAPFLYATNEGALVTNAISEFQKVPSIFIKVFRDSSLVTDNSLVD
jgi:hypothetical protein